MVMKKRNNFVISKISFEDMSIKNLSDLFLDHKYSDENGYGFKDVTTQNDTVKSILIKRAQTYIYEFNSENDTLEKKNISIFFEIPFMMNLSSGYLNVFGNSSNSNKLKSVFRNVLHGKSYTMTNFEITATDFYKKIRCAVNMDLLNVKELSINNFSYKGSAIGRFVSRIINENIVDELIDNYQKDIVKIVLHINNEFTLIIQNNGGFCILCEDEQLEDNIDFVNQIIL